MKAHLTAHDPSNEELCRDVDSGIRGYMTVRERIFVDFHNGHAEPITEREWLLICGAYEQGRCHAKEPT